jgi:aminopeptidase-like protein
MMDARADATTPQAREGERLHRFAARLYPICRSITGAGVRQTLALIRERIPLVVHEVPSGTRVFDWEIPEEWNIEDAAVFAPDGQRVVDFQAHNLHIVSYSEPVSATLTLKELAPRLHVRSDRPDWIPYRTSYYSRSWGFCLRARERAALAEGRYRVEIRSSLARGALSYGELAIPGRTREEVLLFTHVCHPSLANDNTSGMAVATELAAWVASAPRRYTYRFVFAPGTIGSLTWLKRNEARLGRVRHGLVLGLLGDPGALTYKRSRDERREIDEVAAYVVGEKAKVIPFSPYGYDERQFGSPGFDLPVGRLTRSVNGGYPEYHTSGDDLSFITPAALADSLAACREIVEMLEANRCYLNRSPKGEPRLGKRGLYGALGGGEPAEREHAMLWLLNQSDGRHSLVQIAQRSGLPFATLREAAAALSRARLLTEGAKRQRAVHRTNVTRGKASGRRAAKMRRKQS